MLEHAAAFEPNIVEGRFMIHVCHLQLQALVQSQSGVQHKHRHRMNPAFLAPFRFELNDVLHLSFVEGRDDLRRSL